jgi:hypothetical protein
MLPVHCSMQKGLTGQGGPVVEVQGEAKAAQHNICRRHVLLKAQPEAEKSSIFRNTIRMSKTVVYCFFIAL